jgi:DNA modification methylase
LASPDHDCAWQTYIETNLGTAVLADCLEVLRSDVPDESVDLIMTSPPFGLVRKKDYGNPDAHEYVEWFRSFGREFYRVLKPSGSFVIDIGGAWTPGLPTRSLYHFRLLIDLCDEIGFHLAQEFYWWNPSRLPTPAEWVTVRRVRAKDAVDTVWWLSKTPWPKASNRRVLLPYSQSQLDLFENGYQSKRRPSGHEISDKFDRRNAGSIPSNLIAVANTESNSQYLRYCQEIGIEPHPARFPATLPEFFVRMLTDAGDLVIDPFAGSCVTGEVCERTGRRWMCTDVVPEYLAGARGRFPVAPRPHDANRRDEACYSLWRPDALWGRLEEEPLPLNGGATRPADTGRSPQPPEAQTKQLDIAD